MSLSQMPTCVDFIIVGAGVVGLTTALELPKRHPRSRILVLEKETAAGLHASGRSSGVIHAGFYYSADSLKARLSVEGNRQLSAWCDEQDVPINRCGKLVVARNEGELAGLDELLRRSRVNGVELDMVDEAETRRIEPHAVTAGRALWSPTTSAVDPGQVMAALVRCLRREEIMLATSTSWRGRRGNTVVTDRGPVEAAYLINAAGLFADRIAQAYEFASDYRILPFRGMYLRGNTSAPKLRVHVYPVPDLQMPFLGAHFTLAVDGRIKIGPTAMPTLWREGYGLDRTSLSRMSARDMLEVSTACAHMLRRRNFRRHAYSEALKLWRPHLIRHAGAMLRGVDTHQFTEWAPAAIRAQLYDTKRHELVMDFCYQGDDRSMHVLNAVSPAFTCCFAFAEHLVDQIEVLAG